MRISEAGLTSNLEYWKNVADRYRRQRDNALVEVAKLQKILLEQTGKAYDGNDWIREIERTKTSRKFKILSMFRRFK